MASPAVPTDPVTVVRAAVDAVCVVHAVRPDRGKPGTQTAIDKRPVAGAVDVGPLGLAGDTQCDTRHHGGPEQAVYAYASEDAERWAAELGRPIPAGTFGENLRTSGLQVSAAVIGEQWQVGPDDDGALLEVTCARQPCTTFAAWMDEPSWVRRFTDAGVLGAYLRVVREGTVRAGATVRVARRPAHGVTVADTFPHLTAEHAAALLRADDGGELRLNDELRTTAERAVARSGS